VKSRRTVELSLASPRCCDRSLPDASALVFVNRQGNPIRQSSFHDNPWTPAVRVLAGDTVVTVYPLRQKF